MPIIIGNLTDNIDLNILNKGRQEAIGLNCVCIHLLLHHLLQVLFLKYLIF